MKEVWRDIKGFENLYQVSNLGNVRSCDRDIIENTSSREIQHWRGKILTPKDTGKGYLRVDLTVNHKRTVKYVHRLVAEAFIGDIRGLDVNHIDFNRKNNCVDNLEIVSRCDNIRYSQKAGHYNSLYKKQSSRWYNKYESLKPQIQQDLERGIPVYKIEQKYGVTHKTLRKYGYIN